jgi:hypothetical protein
MKSSSSGPRPIFEKLAGDIIKEPAIFKPAEIEIDR